MNGAVSFLPPVVLMSGDRSIIDRMKQDLATISGLIFRFYSFKCWEINDYISKFVLMEVLW